jgi:hypothetical protein
VNMRVASTSAKIACGSVVRSFFCRSFFAPQGEKRPTKDKNPWFA